MHSFFWRGNEMKKIKISFNAPVTLVLVIICFVVTIIGIITNGKSTQLLFMTYHSSLRNPLTYLRFFTHIFGHDGWRHFIGNTTYLLLLGPLLEEKHGSERLAIAILITAVSIGILNYILCPTVALCGASGVVFAFIMLASFTGFKEGKIPLTFILVLVLFLGQQVYEGIILSDNISQLTHVFGGAIGAIMGYILNKE